MNTGRIEPEDVKMKIKMDIHREAVNFLIELSPDIEMALMLNKRFYDIELPKSGYEDILTAYHRLILTRENFNLTEAIMILSNPQMSENVRPDTYDDETPIESTCRHAVVVWCEAVRYEAETIYKKMWQEWLNGKGSCEEIVGRLKE